jgi:hypothetical protein
VGHHVIRNEPPRHPRVKLAGPLLLQTPERGGELRLTYALACVIEIAITQEDASRLWKFPEQFCARLQVMSERGGDRETLGG